MSETVVQEQELKTDTQALPPLTPEQVMASMFPRDDYSSKLKETVAPEVAPAPAPAEPESKITPDTEKKPDEKPDVPVATDNAEDTTLLPEALRPVKKETVTAEAGAEILKKEFGIEPGDFNAITERLKESKVKADEYQAIVNDIQKLDPVVQAMLQANLNGEDPHKAYELAMGKRVDFTKPADKQKMETLIASYASDIMDVEEYIESKELGIEDKRVLAAEKLAVAKFEADQEKWNLNKSKYENQKNEKLEKFNQSIDLSISTASKSMSNPDSKEFKTVVDTVKTQGVVPIFYNQDGTLRSDAVEKVFFAEYGKTFIQDLVKTNQKLIKDLRSKSEELAKATGALPESIPETPGGGGGGTGDQIPAWVKAITERKA